MRTLLIAGLLLVVSVTSAGVETKYDKFKDRSQVSVEISRIPMRGAAPHVLVAFAVFDGQMIDPGEIKDVCLLFVVNSDRWEYLQHQNTAELILLADEQKIAKTIDHYKGDIGHNGVMEAVAFVVTTDEFKSIVNSRRCEGSLQGNVFQFEPAQLSELRRLAVAIGVVEQRLGPPEIVPFEETDAYSALKEKLTATKDMIELAKRDAMSRMQGSEEYRRVKAEVESADQKRKSETGTERLEASKKWLAAKARLDALESGVDASSEVQAANGKVKAVEQEISERRAAYDKQPTTRPGKPIDP